MTPTRQLGEENMWNKLEDARAGLIGIYGLSRAALADNDRFWYYGEVHMGDFTGTIREDIKAIHDNKLNASYPLIQELSDWRRFYAAINAANLFIEKAPDILKKDERYIDQNLNLDIAQARALRAFLYFYIVRIWGDVPLITSSHDGQFENLPRASKDKVLAFVANELIAAEPFLPVRFDGTFPEQTGNYYGKTFWVSDLVRKHSTWALLAHVYAWQGNYAESAKYSQKVMDLLPTLYPSNLSTMFPLSASRTRAIFRGESNEEVKGIVLGFGHRWQIGENSFTSGTLEALTLAQPLINNRSVQAIYVPKDSMVSIYNETGDDRFSIDTVSKNPFNDLWFYNYDKPYPIFKKVYVSFEKDYVEGNQTFATFASSTIITRLEDMALLLAEAKAVLNDRSGAITLLNQIRQKHQLAAYNETLNGSVIDAVFKERQRELIGEGHRWFDLVRYKRIKNNDARFNQLISSGGIYWPIARNILAQNPLLTQNTYWQ